MAQYKVLKQFQDKYTGELYSPNSEIEMTVKRAKEAEKNLEKHGGPFLERVEEGEENALPHL